MQACGVRMRSRLSLIASQALFSFALPILANVQKRAHSQGWITVVRSPGRYPNHGPPDPSSHPSYISDVSALC